MEPDHGEGCRNGPQRCSCLVCGPLERAPLTSIRYFHLLAAYQLAEWPSPPSPSRHAPGKTMRCIHLIPSILLNHHQIINRPQEKLKTKNTVNVPKFARHTPGPSNLDFQPRTNLHLFSNANARFGTSRPGVCRCDTRAPPPIIDSALEQKVQKKAKSHPKKECTNASGQSPIHTCTYDITKLTNYYIYVHPLLHCNILRCVSTLRQRG